MMDLFNNETKDLADFNSLLGEIYPVTSTATTTSTTITSHGPNITYSSPPNSNIPPLPALPVVPSADLNNESVLRSTKDEVSTQSPDQGTNGNNYVEKDNIPKPTPSPPKTAFMWFSLSKTAPNGGGNKMNMQSIADEYKSLSRSQRLKWEDEARKDKLRFNDEKNNYTGSWDLPKRRAKKHPLAPKRPMSAFLRYSKCNRKIVKMENPDVDNTDISRLLGHMWNNASVEEKEPFVRDELRERAVYKADIAKWRLIQKKKEMDEAVYQSEILKSSAQSQENETTSWENERIAPLAPNHTSPQYEAPPNDRLDHYAQTRDHHPAYYHERQEHHPTYREYCERPIQRFDSDHQDRVKGTGDRPVSNEHKYRHDEPIYRDHYDPHAFHNAEYYDLPSQFYDPTQNPPLYADNHNHPHPHDDRCFEDTRYPQPAGRYFEHGSNTHTQPPSQFAEHHNYNHPRGRDVEGKTYPRDERVNHGSNPSTNNDITFHHNNAHTQLPGQFAEHHNYNHPRDRDVEDKTYSRNERVNHGSNTSTNSDITFHRHPSFHASRSHSHQSNNHFHYRQE